MKMYGNVLNRMNEGKNFGGDIEVGTDITMYYWSDRLCFYVTEVRDQKHIKVKPYHVCADREKGGQGSQEWMYFKDYQGMVDYLSKYGIEIGTNHTDKEVEWAFRYGKWCRVEYDENGKPQYHKLNGKVSFGVRDYYYDWEF